MNSRQETRLATVAMLAGLGIWGMTAPAHATTVSLQMDDGKAGSAGAKDSSIWAEDEADNDYGTYYKIRIRTPGGSGPRCNGLVSFPSLIGSAADQVPANATITKATLELWSATQNGAGSTDIWASQLYKDWNEGTGGYMYRTPGNDHTRTGSTWRFAQAYGDQVGEVPWTNVDAAADKGGGLDPADSDQAHPAMGVLGSGLSETWDLTSIVQNWANGQANYGVLLYVQPNSGGWAGYLQSKETTDPNPFKPALTVEYTVAGNPADLNHDGVVNQLDLNIVIGAWQKTGQTHDQGDINGDGVVNQLDLNTVIGNWQKTGEPADVSALSVVPEPASLGLLLAGGMLTLRRRR